MDHPDKASVPPFWRSPAALGLAIALAVSGFYLFTEHRAHLYGWLPYLLILACPLMHVFMHRGHGHGHGHGHGGQPPTGHGHASKAGATPDRKPGHD